MAKEPSPKTKSKPAPKPAKEVSNGSRLYVVPYLLFTVVIGAYCGFLYDENGFRQKAESFPALVLFVQLFEAVEKYSPFHQVSLDFVPSDNRLFRK